MNVDGCFKLRSLGGFCYRALDNQCRVPGKSSPKRFWGNTCALLSFLQADGFWSELFPPSGLEAWLCDPGLDLQGLMIALTGSEMDVWPKPI